MHALIEHISSVDSNVGMQILRYMFYIWVTMRGMKRSEAGD
ncbi:Rpn family recombination-promoting nuclease/putative transposase [Butyrivibrio sp. TB]